MKASMSKEEEKKKSAPTVMQGYPDLRIVPIGQVIPHELHDKQRAHPLVELLRADGYLKSPIIVTVLGDGEGLTEYLILDGTNRQISLDLLGIGYALVQVVEYKEPSVRLLTWNHVISGLSPEDLQGLLSHMQGLKPRITRLETAEDAFIDGSIQAYAVLRNGKALTLTGAENNLEARAEYLQAIVASYINEGRVNRVTAVDRDQLLELYPEMAGVVVFPAFTPEEILTLVREGLRVPSGTRGGGGDEIHQDPTGR